MAVGNQNLFVRNRKQQSILANRTFPVLLAIVCFLVIANTSCDSVGSANVEDTTDLSENQSSPSSSTTTARPRTKPKTKVDPFSMLREIYLGHDSKILTMILPPGGDSVQKFHPNGRYGRRSVNNYAEPMAHVELGKLTDNFRGDNSGSLKSMLHNTNFGDKFADSTLSRFANSDEISDGTVTNMEQELNKLLKCNYTGVSNLYWCNISNNN